MRRNRKKIKEKTPYAAPIYQRQVYRFIATKINVGTTQKKLCPFSVKK